ncbi:hypothetical protein MSWH1_1125 [Methanosarcina sp. WH1]|nr:hypothetical protein MSWH1_1125 [Methanosarcina sp. WH1]
MPRIPESNFHNLLPENINAPKTERIPPATQKIPRTCKRNIVVTAGLYNRNKPTIIAIAPSRRTTHQGASSISYPTSLSALIGCSITSIGCSINPSPQYI